MIKNITLWYRYDKQSDSYKYNHLDFSGHVEARIPEGSTKENNKQFKSSKWLKDFAYIENKKVLYIRPKKGN